MKTSVISNVHNLRKLQNYWLDSSVGLQSTALVLQRSWVQILLRPEFFSCFNFSTAYVLCITVMINHCEINVRFFFHNFDDH